MDKHNKMRKFSALKTSNPFKYTISIWLILLAVIVIFSMRNLYYFDIDYLNIKENTGYSKDMIIRNYDYLIDYNLSLKDSKFKLPDLPSSKEATIHFIEVRNIVQILIKVFAILTITSLVGIYKIVKNNEFSYLLSLSIQVLVLPILLFLPFILNFEASFVIFHKILFRNNYWQFDSTTDPVIDILPEEFFFHCFMLFIGILLVFSIISFAFYKRLKKNK